MNNFDGDKSDSRQASIIEHARQKSLMNRRAAEVLDGPDSVDAEIRVRILSPISNEGCSGSPLRLPIGAEVVVRVDGEGDVYIPDEDDPDDGYFLEPAEYLAFSADKETTCGTTTTTNGKGEAMGRKKAAGGGTATATRPAKKSSGRKKAAKPSAVQQQFEGAGFPEKPPKRS